MDRLHKDDSTSQHSPRDLRVVVGLVVGLDVVDFLLGAADVVVVGAAVVVVVVEVVSFFLCAVSC